MTIEEKSIARFTAKKVKRLLQDPEFIAGYQTWIKEKEIKNDNSNNT